MPDLIAPVTQEKSGSASLGQLGEALGTNLELNLGKTGQWRKKGSCKLASFFFSHSIDTMPLQPSPTQVVVLEF